MALTPCNSPRERRKPRGRRRVRGGADLSQADRGRGADRVLRTLEGLHGMQATNAVCFVYTCRRLIGLSLIAGTV